MLSLKVTATWAPSVETWALENSGLTASTRWAVLPSPMWSQHGVPTLGVPDPAVPYPVLGPGLGLGDLYIQPQAAGRKQQREGFFVARHHRVFEDDLVAVGPRVVGRPGLAAQLQVHLGGVLL